MGYLDEYSDQEAHREKRARNTKRALLVSLVILLVAGVLYYTFKNYREEKRVEAFLATVQRGDYPGAYGFWGCRVDAPCPNYSYKDFLDDWGPQSEIGKLQSYRRRSSHERGSGVVVSVALNDRLEKKLWVEKSNAVVGFAPPF